MIGDLHDTGAVTDSSSDYTSLILLVPKKNSERRLRADFPALNKITKKDRYPLPLIDDQFHRSHDKRLITSLDLASECYQMSISKETREREFITPDGHYECTRMPFGLVNAPSVFQRIINTVLGPLKKMKVMAYMDNLLIPSMTSEEVLVFLRQVLEVLKRLVSRCA